MKGKLISIEGVDGCGKSTHIPFIKKFLEDQGIEVLVSREPGGTLIGEEIRKILLSSSDKMFPITQILLFAASRVEHIHRVIIPALNNGIFVITDRYYDSNVAYQGGGFGLFRDVETINHVCGNLNVIPDMTLLFDLDIIIAKNRMSGIELDSFELMDEKFHQKVRNSYLEISKHQNRFKVIDSNLDIPTIQEIIKIHLKELFNDTY